MEYKEDFQKIICQLHFEPKNLISGDQRLGVYIARGFITGKEVLLKIYSKNNKEKFYAVKKEILVDKVVSSHNKIAKTPIDIIKVIAHGENNKVAWIVRQFRKGSPLTPTKNYQKNDILINKYCLIDKRFLNTKLKILPQIFYNLEAFRRVDKKLLMRREVSKYFVGRFQPDLENYGIKVLGQKLGFSLDSQLQNYNKNKSTYLNKNNLYVSVSDLNLANIMVNEDEKVIFFDFEQLCLDNYMIDPSFFWLFLWRYPDWQKKVLDHFVKTFEDKNFFISSVIRQIIGWYDNIFVKYSDKKENIILMRKLYKSHIWVRYLEAAKDGYGAIIKIK
ncbi:MAG: hypothetical protein Athens101428_574 [Candidatus Berkelbacteria bacterium Athens1014_28]|uniref:Aminoglycoside phosphotransferase domain-containing protein n=1 Tax=Candidatus Berkelbacteria bacterium Athens1014_28 TaxID=2017145 RepID=A0A554LLL4_9BACT|nr:MAG: hypothetical protein Athens101428_574 [Candidatus Berkelbacteria bacterium Athens1014_28]